MLSIYIKIAWRDLIKNKGASFINISGLAVGMAVAMLIGLWIWDELAFNKYHQRYDRIAQVMEHGTYNGKVVPAGSYYYIIEVGLNRPTLSGSVAVLR